jgi:hypothetical protein
VIPVLGKTPPTYGVCRYNCTSGRSITYYLPLYMM